MKFPRGAQRIGRIIGMIMFGMGLSFLILFMVAMTQEGVLIEGIGILVVWSVFWFGCVFLVMREFPCVELTEQGIAARVLFLTRYYTWREIKQAGILYRLGRGIHYNELVLVTPKGSQRRYKDKTFLLRNPFTLIMMPYYSVELRQFVAKYYGMLDFDLSDGQSEQSICGD